MKMKKKHTCNISYLWNESECFSLANFINLLKSSGSKSRLDAEGNEIGLLSAPIIYEKINNSCNVCKYIVVQLTYRYMCV